MNENKAIVWFRQDLRLHDNEALVDAIAQNQFIVPVYIFDPRVFIQLENLNIPKTDSFRAKFIIESVTALRNALLEFNVNLIVRVGNPEEEIFKIARRLKTKWVYCNRERTQEEVLVQDRLEVALWSIGQEMRYSRGKMLFYTQDLPFPITHTPDTFRQFYKEVGRFVDIRKPLPVPKEIPSYEHYIDLGEIPSLIDLNLENTVETNCKEEFCFKGGEEEGLKRLDMFVERFSKLKSCSFFSPWLSQGCLSPKTVYFAIQESENKDEIIQHLMVRDFFRLMGKKHLNSIFIKGGITQNFNKSFSQNTDILNDWINGKTEEPIVNAYMNQLKSTGHISLLGRKITSHFLVNTLNVDWRMGAAYFESILIDYDPCSNWVNWNEIAGLTIDARHYCSTNYIQLHKNQDPENLFLKKWISEYSVI